MPTEAQYAAVRIAQIRLNIACKACDNATTAHAIKVSTLDREEMYRSLNAAQDVLESCK
jgi:hypothetical protein